MSKTHVWESEGSASARWMTALQCYAGFVGSMQFSQLIIYMKKLLDSNWLRTVQFFLNTVQKRGN